MDIERYLNEAIRGIQSEDREFANVLCKWKRLLWKAITKVANITQEFEEDLLQDFLLELHKSNLYFKKDFYRYKRHLYEVVCWDGSIVHLVSNPFNVRFKHDVWVPVSNISKIKKSSLSSFIYHQIQQYKVDRLNAFCRARNGFRKDSYEEKTVVVHEGNYKRLEKRCVAELTRSEIMSLEDPMFNSHDGDATRLGDTLKSSDPDPLSQYEEIRMITESNDDSEVAQNTLRCILSRPDVRDYEIASILKCSSRKVRVAKREIMNRFLSGTLIEKNRCYFDGLELNEVYREGDRVLLALPSGRTLWADQDDVVFRPSGVRPVQLRASEVR